jgi:hypothetical protein
MNATFASPFESAITQIASSSAFESSRKVT